MYTAARQWLRSTLRSCGPPSRDVSDIRASKLDVPVPPRGTGEVAARKEDVRSDHHETRQDLNEDDEESIVGGDGGLF